jgi:hypothetical protein
LARICLFCFEENKIIHKQEKEVPLLLLLLTLSFLLEVKSLRSRRWSLPLSASSRRDWWILTHVVCIGGLHLLRTSLTGLSSTTIGSWGWRNTSALITTRTVPFLLSLTTVTGIVMPHLIVRDHSLSAEREEITGATNDAGALSQEIASSYHTMVARKKYSLRGVFVQEARMVLTNLFSTQHTLSGHHLHSLQNLPLHDSSLEERIGGGDDNRESEKGVDVAAVAVVE